MLSKASLNKLINNLEKSMDDVWEANAHCEPADFDSVYIDAQMIEDQGIGGVLIPTIHGKLRWFSLEEMAF